VQAGEAAALGGEVDRTSIGSASGLVRHRTKGSRAAARDRTGIDERCAGAQTAFAACASLGPASRHHDHDHDPKRLRILICDLMADAPAPGRGKAAWSEAAAMTGDPPARFARAVERFLPSQWRAAEAVRRCGPAAGADALPDFVDTQATWWTLG
jgi:hypothetical protein